MNRFSHESQHRYPNSFVSTLCKGLHLLSPQEVIDKCEDSNQYDDIKVNSTIAITGSSLIPSQYVISNE